MKLSSVKESYVLEEIADIELIKDLQFNLNRVGYPLIVDGVMGDKTLRAWAKFKKDRYLDRPSEIGLSSAELLLEAPGVPVGKFYLPTNKIGWVSSPYGMRSMGFHKGIDIAANEGTPVYAVADGVVVSRVSNCRVGNWKCGGGYGNVVYLRHKLKEFDESRYAHLLNLAVGIENGVEIEKGSIIGFVGNTGHSFGNHLHFELRKNDKAFNPLNVINPII